MLVLSQGQLASLSRQKAQRQRDALIRACAAARIPIDAQPAADADVGLVLRDVLGRVSRLVWNGSGWELTTPSGLRCGFERDIYGRIEKATLISGAELAFRYQGKRLCELRIGGRSLIQMQWERDLLRSITRGDGEVTHFQHDQLGRLVGVTRKDERTLELAYTPRGRVKAFADGRGHRTEVSYDGFGCAQKISEPDGRQFHMHYDDQRRLAAMDINGTRSLDISRHEGTIAARYGDGAEQRFVFLSQRLVAAHNEDAVYERRFDDQGFVERESLNGFEVSYEYSAAGELVAQRFPEGGLLRFERDEEGRIVELVQQAGGSLSLSYDDSGSVAELRYPNGVSWGVERDAMGTERQIELLDPRGGSLWALRYEYDLLQRVKRFSSPYAAQSVSYDDYDRLSKVEVKKAGAAPSGYEPLGLSIGRDASGNDLQQGARYSETNQLVAFGDERLSYDAWGNLTSRETPLGTLRYVFRAGRQLSAVSLDGVELASYRYDPAGRRIEKRTPAGTNRYSWVGPQLWRDEFENSAGQRQLREYVWLPGGRVPLLMVEDGKRYGIHYDRRLAPFALTDERGQVVWRAELDVNGHATIFEEQVTLPWRLPGQYFDAETGLHYNVSRYYDPALGRYLSPDPIGVAGGSFNLYLYCDGDPVNRIDPLGLNVLTGMGTTVAIGAGTQLLKTGTITDPGAIGTAAVSGAATSMLTSSMGLENPILNAVAGTAVSAATNSVISGVAGGFLGASDTPSAAATGAAGKLPAAGLVAGEPLLDLPSWRDYAPASVVGVLDNMDGKLTSMGESIGGFMRTAVLSPEDALSSIGDGLGSMGTMAGNAFDTVMDKLSSPMAMASDAYDFVADGVTSMGGAMTDAASSMVAGVSGAVGRSVDAISSTFDNIMGDTPTFAPPSFGADGLFGPAGGCFGAIDGGIASACGGG